MNILDLVKYTGTQTAVDTFNVSVAPGFEIIPSGGESPFLIRDSAGTFAIVTGTLTGSTFTAVQLLRSRSGTIPIFSGIVNITSTYGADLIGRNFGIAGFPVAGQSNPMGWDSGYDAEIDFIDGGITQFRYNAKDNTGTLYTPNAVVPAKHPLYWAEQTTVENTVSPVPHMANALRMYGGHQHVQILPGAQGSTAFGPISSGVGVPGNQWVKGGVLYERLLAMVILFLNKSPDNYLPVFLLMLGESDAISGRTEAEFSTFTDEFWTNFKADVLAGTVYNYNMEFTALVVVGMNDTFIAFEPNAVNIENSMKDVGNRITRSAYVSMTGQPSSDNYHNATEANRILGIDLFILGYYAAMANWTLYGTGIAASITASATLTAEIQVPIEANIVASATLTASIGEPGASIAADITASAILTADVTLPAAAVFEAEFLAGVGVTKDGSNRVSSWSGGNGHTMDQVGADSLKPVDASDTGLTFDGINDNMLASAGLLDILNSSVGYTIVMQYTTTTSGQVMMGTSYTFISSQATTTNVRMQDTGATDDFLASDTNDGTLHYIAITLDRVGGVKQVIIDGVLEDTNSDIVAQPADALAWFIGSGASGSFASFHWAGEIHKVGVLEGPSTLSEVTTLVSGW